MSTEGCDAGVSPGCKPDCSGPLPCDICTGGSPISADTCTDQCVTPLGLPNASRMVLHWYFMHKWSLW